MVDLSIIIPVYNTEQDVLNRCLESISKMNKNIYYEVIVINDGSNSILENKYKENCIKYRNTVFITKENSGVSATRNLGIKEAKGKYITFVDSDDIIYPQSIKSEYFSSEADIIVFDKVIINKKNKFKSIEFDNNAESYIDKNIVIKNFIKDNKFHNPFAKFIKKEFLNRNRIFFDTNFIEGEDALFNLEMLLCDPNIYYANRVLYGYYYDYNTYNTRWTKYPEKVYANFIELYNKKVEVLEKFYIGNKEDIVSGLNRNYLNATYSYSLALSKKKSNEYEYILNEMSQFSKKLTQISPNFLMKVKKYLLENRRWKIMYGISNLREFYLKHIKTNYKF